MGYEWDVPSWYFFTQLLNMAIEIVDLPMENGDVPISYVNLYQRVGIQV